MALILAGCFETGCESLSYVDRTGTYNAEDQPGGYGGPNIITDPSDFATYTLRIWDPSKDYYASPPDPTLVFDLLADVPSPDSNGYYTWTFYPADFGLTTITDGQWYWEVLATEPDIAPGEWQANAAPLVLVNIRADLDQKMLKWTPGCGCAKPGQVSPAMLFADYLVLKCGGTCSTEQANKGIKYLQSMTPNCC